MSLDIKFSALYFMIILKYNHFVTIEKFGVLETQIYTYMK